MCVIYANNCQNIYPVGVDSARLLPRVVRPLTDGTGAAGAAGVRFLLAGFDAFDAASFFLGDAFDSAFFFLGGAFDAASLFLGVTAGFTAFPRLDLNEGWEGVFTGVFTAFPLVGLLLLAGEGEAEVGDFTGRPASSSSSLSEGHELS